MISVPAKYLSFCRSLLTKPETPRKIGLVYRPKDVEGKKDGTSRLQRAGGCCEPVGEPRGSLLPEFPA